MIRLRERGAAARVALEKLGPPPAVDIHGLLDSELSEEGWKVLPLDRGRDLLKLAIREVPIFSPELPIAERFDIWWHGQGPPPSLSGSSSSALG